jgi:hypothetical protein
MRSAVRGKWLQAADKDGADLFLIFVIAWMSAPAGTLHPQKRVSR